MRKRDKLVTPVRITPMYMYRGNEVNYFDESNNHAKAALEAFRLLSSKKASGRPLKGFDMELCKFLVNKYNLSCSDCKIGECENHGLDQFR